MAESLTPQREAHIRSSANDRHDVSSVHIAELFAELERVRGLLAEHVEGLNDLAALVSHWHLRAVTAEVERDALQKRLHDAAMTKVWTNEDGKKFVFVEDLAGPLLGLVAKAGDR